MEGPRNSKYIFKRQTIFYVLAFPTTDVVKLTSQFDHFKDSLWRIYFRKWALAKLKPIFDIVSELAQTTYFYKH